MMLLSYAGFLFLIWVLLSGHFSPLLLGLGAVSVALTVLLARRMRLFDHEAYPVHLWSKMPAFLVFLLKEIIRANIDVMRRILSFRKTPISPTMVALHPQLETDLGQVLHANAITLTPGTVSVELDDGKVLVHALSKEAADDLSTGAMASAVPDEIAESVSE